MPIYDYACGACGRVTEVIHGINDQGPRFCPNCGAERTMRKALTAAAVVFKGSGWAKLDRRSSSGGSRSTNSSSKPDTGTATRRSSTSGEPAGGPSSGPPSGPSESPGGSGAASSSDGGGD